MQAQIQNEASHKIQDYEVIVHDQLVKSREQVAKAEAEIQQTKMEQ